MTETWADANRWRRQEDEPLGYVCDDCGRWVAMLDAADDDCPHLRLHLPENLQPEVVAEAKERVRRRLDQKAREDYYGVSFQL